MVAKSYTNYEFLCEPFKVDNKMYINVRNPKTGTERRVRWYSEREYMKLYPEAKASNVSVHDAYYKPQKEVLGFTKGYITIFKGNTFDAVDWFKASIARYCRYWGWYIISTEEVPADLPAGVEPVRLPWEKVGGEDGKLYIEEVVRRSVEALVYDSSPSEYVGSIGDKIEVELTVTNAIEVEGNYGRSTMHIMEDANKNVYVWTTAARSWEKGAVKKVKGTIKDHKLYRNTKQTILTRCSEIA